MKEQIRFLAVVFQKKKAILTCSTTKDTSQVGRCASVWVPVEHATLSPVVEVVQGFDLRYVSASANSMPPPPKTNSPNMIPYKIQGRERSVLACF